MAGTLLHKILYVEDDPDIQEIARLALIDVGGFDVRICSFGREALQIAPVFSPDLIILDVMMPDMDGISTFKALRDLEATKHTSIIFLTAKVQPEEVKQYYAMGALEVIYKPFDPLTLADFIKQIWKKASDER
ncbi:MAG: response regulator [Spirochaetales bacterium]|nr:response regulator [Spirochaetales bacterium]